MSVEWRDDFGRLWLNKIETDILFDLKSEEDRKTFVAKVRLCRLVGLTLEEMDEAVSEIDSAAA